MRMIRIRNVVKIWKINAWSIYESVLKWKCQFYHDLGCQLRHFSIASGTPLRLFKIFTFACASKICNISQFQKIGWSIVVNSFDYWIPYQYSFIFILIVTMIVKDPRTTAKTRRTWNYRKNSNLRYTSCMAKSVLQSYGCMTF